MPKLEIHDLKQKAVLWTRVGFDRYGQQVVANPVEINVRYEEDIQETIDADATPIAKTATVFVDRDIERGSILWLGTLASLPSAPTNLVEVLSLTKTPDIKGRNFQRTVNVNRWKDEVVPTTTTTTTSP